MSHFELLRYSIYKHSYKKENMKKITVILLSIISIALAQDNNMSFGFRLNVIETNPIVARSPQIFESSFSYIINEKFALTANFSHLSNTEERNYTDGQSGQYNSIRKKDYSINMLSIGAKFFFKDREESKVNPFIIASIDKYFASITQSNSQNPSEDYSNSNKIFEDQNSPIYIGLGFGTEYFFNSDFSMITTLEDKILSYEFKERSQNWSWPTPPTPTYNETSYKYSRSYFKLTVGFNFYF